MANSNFATELNGLGVSLHSAILRNLIGEIEQAIVDGRIRSEDGRHSVYDFIGKFLGRSNPSSTWKRFVEADSAVIAICYNWQFAGERQKETAATSLAGLIYIAYMGSGKFSHNLRSSSAALIAAEFKSQKRSPASEPKPEPENTPENTIAPYPFTIDRLHQQSGIASKYQVRDAIRRDFEEGKDYATIDKTIVLSEHCFFVLLISFRSKKGTSIADLPEYLKLHTESYFRWVESKKNLRTGKKNCCHKEQLSFEF